jgi:hypothetical protein
VLVDREHRPIRADDDAEWDLLDAELPHELRLPPDPLLDVAAGDLLDASQVFRSSAGMSSRLMPTSCTDRRVSSGGRCSVEKPSTQGRHHVAQNRAP